MATQPQPSDSILARFRDGAHLPLRGGETGEFCGFCTLTGKYRVRTYKDTATKRPIAPPKIEKSAFEYTTWLLDLDGLCRGDKAPCALDYVGGAA